MFSYHVKQCQRVSGYVCIPVFMVHVLVYYHQHLNSLWCVQFFQNLVGRPLRYRMKAFIEGIVLFVLQDERGFVHFKLIASFNVFLHQNIHLSCNGEIQSRGYESAHCCPASPSYRVEKKGANLYNFDTSLPHFWKKWVA